MKASVLVQGVDKGNDIICLILSEKSQKFSSVDHYKKCLKKELKKWNKDGDNAKFIKGQLSACDTFLGIGLD